MNKPLHDMVRLPAVCAGLMALAMLASDAPAQSSKVNRGDAKVKVPSANAASDASRSTSDVKRSPTEWVPPRSESLLGAKLLPTTWERWQSLEPGQRKKYIETLRRYTRAPARHKRAAKAIAHLKKTSPETLDRLKLLLPKVQDFVASLTPSQVRRLRAMTTQERARWIAQRFARKRLQRGPRPAAPVAPR